MRERFAAASAQPSIKGSVFGPVLEDLRENVSKGLIPREEAEAALATDAPVAFDATIHRSSWYCIRAYGNMLELLKKWVGGGKNEYLVARGARTAEALMKSDIYQQMEYVNRTQVAGVKDPAERFKAFGRDLRLLTTLNHSIYNFGKIELRTDPEHPDRYLVEHSEAEAFPDAAAWTNIGFRNRMAAEHDSHDLWTWERPRPDLIVFRMTRAV